MRSFIAAVLSMTLFSQAVVAIVVIAGLMSLPVTAVAGDIDYRALYDEYVSLRDNAIVADHLARHPGEAGIFLRQRASFERLTSVAKAEWDQAQGLRRAAFAATVGQLSHDPVANALGRQMMPTRDAAALEMQARANVDEANLVLIDLVVGYRELKARLDQHQPKRRKREAPVQR
jgi:hypothetical protein